MDHFSGSSYTPVTNFQKWFGFMAHPVSKSPHS